MKLLTKLYILSLLTSIICNSQTIPVSLQNDSDTNRTTRVDTLSLNGQQFIQTNINEHFYSLTSLKGDTIIQAEDFYFKLQILDFNEDGYKDLRVYIFSNTPNQCDNYLYDKDSKTFKLLQHCGLDFKKIPKTNYYFTQFKTGCAGSNFGSYLYKLENFDFTLIAYIEENGCDFDTLNFPKNYKIYKVTNTKQEKLKLLKICSYYNFEGIEKYWNNNNTKFTKSKTYDTKQLVKRRRH